MSIQIRCLKIILNSTKGQSRSFASKKEARKAFLKEIGSIRHPREFYDKSAEQLARCLLGQILVRRLKTKLLCGRIVETEAYLGEVDEASHSYEGRKSKKSESTFEEPGTACVSSVHGVFSLFGISSAGLGESVLIRALEPLSGVHIMRIHRLKFWEQRNAGTRRRKFSLYRLCSGPGQLAISLKIANGLDGADLTSSESIWTAPGPEVLEDDDVVLTPRVGLSKTVTSQWLSAPLRFYIFGHTSVSKRSKKDEDSKLDALKVKIQ